jgi:hypothetical protein
MLLMLRAIALAFAAAHVIDAARYRACIRSRSCSFRMCCQGEKL